MPVKAIGEYKFEPRDKVENFHGNQLVFWLWEQHLMFASPIAVPLPPSMPWEAVMAELLPGFYSQHPDWASVEWDKIEWELDGEPFTPDPAKTLEELGVGHKSFIRFRTPGLEGMAGVGF